MFNKDDFAGLSKTPAIKKNLTSEIVLFISNLIPNSRFFNLITRGLKNTSVLGFSSPTDIAFCN